MRISDWSSDVCSSYLAFVAVEWNKDLFAAIRERTSETAGYGRHVLIGPTHFLDLEVGVGARQQETSDIPRERETEFIERGAAKYRRSEERRVGKVCVGTCGYRGSPVQ